MLPDFELIAHTADLQIRVYGATKSSLFRNALRGMFQSIKPQASHCIVIDERLVCPTLDRHHTVNIRSHDTEQLLVDFLSEALYLSDIHNEAYLDVTMSSITSTTINATLYGVAVTGFEGSEIKAVTYHNLALRQIDGVWQTDIVFDI